MKSVLCKSYIKQLFLKADAQCRRILSVSTYITSRRYSDEKSIYQREEEGKKPRTVYGKPYPEWRKPWIQRDGEWTTKLALFNEKNPSTEIMNALQKLPNIDLSSIKEWWASMKVIQEIQNQKYLPERVAALGANLAAVHFFTYRNCAVRLKGAKNWTAGNVLDLNLPDHYVEDVFIEAVDCSKFHHNGIRFEGLENLSGLNFLKWLSLKNQKYVDVWCLDRIAGLNGDTLEFLDISGCQLDENCVFALVKISALKMLVITDPGDNIKLQAALSFLEQEKPDLIINVIEVETKSNNATDNLKNNEI